MTTWLEKRLARRTGATGLETERLLLDLTETFAAQMETKDIKRAELARRMGVDRAVVTRVMAGDRNVTLRTLVSVASSLGCRLHVTVEDAPANPAVESVTARGIADVVSKTAQSAVTTETCSDNTFVTTSVGVPQMEWDVVMRVGDEHMAIECKAPDMTSLLNAAQTIAQVPSSTEGDERGIKAAA